MDVLLCECGHRQWEHIGGVSQCDGPLGCKCRKFKPLATFQQLKEAWELVNRICQITRPGDEEQPWEILYELHCQARRIRGEKGGT